MQQKAQQWSFEVILAVSLFLVVFVLAIAFLVVLPEQGERDLQVQSATLLDEAESSAGFVRDKEVDTNRLNDWYNATSKNETFKALKDELGLTDDFCIFFLDENGAPVKFIYNSTLNYTGVGTDKIMLGDEPCGAPVEE